MQPNGHKPNYLVKEIMNETQRKFYDKAGKSFMSIPCSHVFLGLSVKLSCISYEFYFIQIIMQYFAMQSNEAKTDIELLNFLSADIKSMQLPQLALLNIF